MNNKIEDLLNVAKFNEMIHKKEVNDDKKNTVIWVLAIIGAITAIAGIAFAVYKYFTPDYLEDFDDDLDDDFDDDYYDEDDDNDLFSDGTEE